MEDHEIIRLYFARDEAAIRETDRKYGGFCANISWNILQNTLDVEECVNDTYLHIWNSIPPVKPLSLMAYLGKVIRNLSLNLRKAKCAQKRGGGQYDLVYDELSQVVPSSESVEDSYGEIVLRDLLNRWLATLPEEHRLAFVGRYWFFDSIRDISARMGCSEGKTKMLLLRLRRRLKVYLEGEGISL